MSKAKTFVSYDHSEDANYKRLLQAWDANPDFEFEFDSRGPNVAIDSDDASVIKSALTKKMKESSHLLVIVGEKSSKSKWMTWEIERAKQSDVLLKLAAVKLSSLYTAPSGLLGVGTAWATSFTRDRIVAALNSATIGY
ncbi:TIR domain-containing protein [Mesorhizobium sp. ORM6]